MTPITYKKQPTQPTAEQVRKLRQLEARQPELRCYARGASDSLEKCAATAEEYDVLNPLINPQQANLEREVSDSLSKALHLPTGNALTFNVPFSAFTRDALPLTIGTAANGGNTVQTGTGDQLIPFLRTQSAVTAAGATIIPGCRQNLSILRQNTSPAIQWFSESDTAVNEHMTLSTVPVTFFRGTAQCGYTHQLLQQAQVGQSFRQLVTNDLTALVAQAVDTAALTGTGVNQPTAY
jgi:HK97 family phage major capsid protein